MSHVVEFQFLSISQPRADWWPPLKKEVQQDSYYADFLQKHPTQVAHKLLQRDGVWFKKDKVYLSPTSPLLPKIMAHCHSSPIGGHFGFHKTLSRIKQSFFGSNVCQMVKDFLQQCDVCQRFKTDCMKQRGCFNHYPFLLKCGLMSQWTLLRGYHILMDILPSWWSSID